MQKGGERNGAVDKVGFSYKKAAYDNHKAEYPVYLSDEKACSQALYKPF